MKPICMPCQRFFRMKQSGFYFLEGMPKKNDAEPGRAHPEQWTPYKLWVGDRWECEGCGAVILSGFGRAPIAEHYQSDFARLVENTHGNQFQVNDC